MVRVLRHGMSYLMIGALMTLALSSCSSSEDVQALLSSHSMPTNEFTSSEPASTPSQTPSRTELPSPTTSAPSPTLTPTPTAVHSASSTAPLKVSAQPKCGTRLSESELTKLTTKLPPAVDSEGTVMGWDWDGVYAEKNTYDECAGLSWVTYPIERGTGSSPYVIALFHQGTYLGVATSDTFGFFPMVKRLSDTKIEVTYTYLRGNDSNAGASGRAVSTYTWDTTTQSVRHAGKFPPK